MAGSRPLSDRLADPRREPHVVSIYPCMVHGRRVAGRLDTAYPSIVHSGSRRSRKLRVCPTCLDELFAVDGVRWVQVSMDDGDEFEPVCAACGTDLDGVADPHAFFLTVYRRGQEREDWYGQYCPKCASDLVDKLQLEA